MVRAARDSGYLLVALFAVIWAYLYVRWGIDNDTFGFDFKGTLWDPATEVRTGGSPYPEPVIAEVDVGNPSLYPPLPFVALAPVTVLPYSVVVVLWSVLLVGSLAVSLWALDVRDIRCWAVAAISAPVVGDVVLGNMTLALVPMVALAWRWRDHWARAGVLIGVAIGSKFLVWPLLFWLLGTRRYRAFGVALGTTCAAILAPWAVFGFEGFSAYPDLLRVASEIYGVHSYSVTTMLSALGVDAEPAGRGAFAVGVMLAGAAFVAGRRGTDPMSISIAVLAAILGSPIVWEYNYALALVPLAIARPRFSGLWMLFPLIYLSHRLPRPRLLSTELEPGGTACCRPPDVPEAIWVFSHAPPGLWPALGHLAVAAVIVACAAWGSGTHSATNKTDAARRQPKAPRPAL